MIYVWQCALPVFENLLPEPHNSQAQWLLFLLCHWHALAKLCMHTDYTLDIMEHTTAQLAQQMCNFSSETCPAFATKELCHEAESWRQRKAQGGPSKSAYSPAVDVCQPKTLNLCTYKVHTLKDYHDQIKMFGTTDSFSTQLVRLPLHHSLWLNSGRENMGTALEKVGLLERVAKHLSPNWYLSSAAKKEFARSKLS